MKRRWPQLAAPGPVPVPEAVRQAMAVALPHHRTADFEAILGRVAADLKWLFQTEGDALVLTGTGTTGMEAAVVNFADPKGLLLTCGGGKFAERWRAIAEGHRLPTHEIPVEWGDVLTPEALEAALEQHPQTTAVALTACETSTGVRHPIEALCEVVRRRDDLILIVDGITAVGVFDLPMDRLGIDVLVTGSQKIFAVPPGLTCLGVSPRAWRLQPQPGAPRYSHDLLRERQRQRQSQTAFSPATSLILGLEASLRLLREEGLEGMWSRHNRNARAVRAGVEALGLSLVAQSPCDAVTAVQVPDGLDAGGLLSRARALGVMLAGGQGPLAGSIVRIGHLGSHDRPDVILALSTLELALAAEGWSVDFGRGVGAALRVYAS